jgi:molybdopterin/thiamine biosynthesis adenylyltransferase/proteasome lid subunit RPN8/RPN11
VTNTIAFAEQHWEELVASLQEPRESAAVLLAGTTTLNDSLLLTVNEICWVPEAAYEHRDERSLEIASAGWMHALKRAASRGLCPVFIHTHPHSSPEPSFRDDAVDEEIQNVFRIRTNARYYVSLVLGVEQGTPSLHGRIYEVGAPREQIDRVRVVGQRVSVNSAHGAAAHDNVPDADANIFDRQIRAFGVDGQAVLRRLCVGVVGAGGTGSAVAEQLARLGVGSLLLVDKDDIDASNVTRIYGSTVADVGEPKARVVGEHLRAIGLDTVVQHYVADVTERPTMELLRGCDVVFCCTDSQSSRTILSRLAYWYLIPVVDMGVVIASHGPHEVGIYGRVTVATPGEPCLLCRGEIDPQRAAEERYSGDELSRLAEEGYARGLDDPDPAVVAYTTMTASYAVADLLQRLFGFARSRLSGKLLLLISDRSVRRPAGSFRTGCYCAPTDKWGLGDRTAPLGLTWSA